MQSGEPERRPAIALAVLYPFLNRPMVGQKTICAMLKILVLLLYLLQPGEACDCPQVSDLQTSGKANNSCSISWNGNSSASAYIVKYTRLADGYESPMYSTSGCSFTFGNLVKGQYKFEVAAVCNGETSNLIGIEDLIEN